MWKELKKAENEPQQQQQQPQHQPQEKVDQVGIKNIIFILSFAQDNYMIIITRKMHLFLYIAAIRSYRE